MQKPKVFFFKSKEIFNFFKAGYSFLLMFLVYIIGIAIGNFIIKNRFISEADIISVFSLDKIDSDFWNYFYRFLINWSLSIVVIAIFGTCMVGAVIVPCLVSVKGIEYGILSGYLYSKFSFNGIIYILLLVVPAVLCAAFCLFFTARDSFVFSTCLLKHTLPEPRADYLYPRLTLFLKRVMLYLFFTALSALIYAALNTAFFDSVKLL